MRARNIIVICGSLSLFALMNDCAEAGMVKDLQFVPHRSSPGLVVTYDGDAKFDVVEDKKSFQIILNVRGATLPASLTRTMDLSTSASPVIQITPYNTSENGANAKIVLQMTKPLGFSAKGKPGRFELGIINTVQKTVDTPSSLPPLKAGDVPAKKTNRFVAKTWDEADQVNLNSSATVKEDKNTEKARELIETLNSAEESKVYKGTKVTVEAAEVDIHDIFRLVGAASNLNIITKDVNFKISVSLRDIPWDQLLDIILQQNQLKASVVGNVIRVTTLENYNKEQMEKKKSITLEQDLDPVIMAIVPLSYAKADEMKKMIEQLLVRSDGVLPPGANTTNQATPPPPPPQVVPGTDGVKELAQAFIKGKIEVDLRSNSLVITNTADIVKRIKRLVAELDVPLPQVLIESKIVIASEIFSKSLGLSWGARVTPGSGRAGMGFSFNDGSGVRVNNPAGAEVAAFTVTGTPADAATGAPAGGAIGVALGAGRAANLTAALNIAELDGTSKTVASPRIIVNNKQLAKVTDGLRIATQGTTFSGGASTNTTIYTDALMSLDVTPQITSVGSVLMDLKIIKEAPTGAAGNIDSKSITTQVMVDSGSTIVLGGVYQYAATKFTTGIPVLKDLPFIGRLFSVENENLSKNELMVFITPKILDTGSADGAQ